MPAACTKVIPVRECSAESTAPCAPGGAMYASFKTGGEETIDQYDRYYNFPDEALLRVIARTGMVIRRNGPAGGARLLQSAGRLASFDRRQSLITSAHALGPKSGRCRGSRRAAFGSARARVCLAGIVDGAPGPTAARSSGYTRRSENDADILPLITSRPMIAGPLAALWARRRDFVNSPTRSRSFWRARYSR